MNEIPPKTHCRLDPSLYLFIGLALIATSVLAVTLGWHRFVPILGRWEHFQYYYSYGAADPYLSFAIAPRANLGGKGYPLLDLGIYLTDLLGLSLPGFRALMYVYALATFALLVVVFARWFGAWPALAGVTVTLLSTGYLIFSNQLLVALPTLMLCVLLVERCQSLSDVPESKWRLVAVAIVVALLIIHYAMGRFFAVGWLAFYFADRVISQRTAAGPGASWFPVVRAEARKAGLIVLLSVVVLCLLSYRNAYFLLDPWNVFFPRIGTEVEMDPADLWTTITINLGHIGEMIFPFIRLSGDGLPEALISGFRAPLLNFWHTPFLILGFAVATARAVTRPPETRMPYLALHAIFLMTVLLSVFSQHYNGRSTISVYRLFCGYFAFAGYVAVAFLWLSDLTVSMPRAIRVGTAAILLAGIGVWGLTWLEDFRVTSEQRLDRLAEIDEQTGRFRPIPETLPYGTKATTYLQARYARLADMMAPALVCAEPNGPLILRIAPALLLSRGKYPAIHYLRLHNDLSATLAFYLADRGIDAGHLVIHSQTDSGYRSRGDGYAGKPRVFSGPIAWKNGKIVYRATPPLQADLKTTSRGAFPRVLIAFSDLESRLAAEQVRESGRHPVTSRRFDDLLDLRSAATSPTGLCPPTP